MMRLGCNQNIWRTSDHSPVTRWRRNTRGLQRGSFWIIRIAFQSLRRLCKSARGCHARGSTYIFTEWQKLSQSSFLHFYFLTFNNDGCPVLNPLFIGMPITLNRFFNFICINQPVKKKKSPRILIQYVTFPHRASVQGSMRVMWGREGETQQQQIS